MTLFFLLRLLHLTATIIWLGAGLSIPVAFDIRRSLARGIAHGEDLVARLSTITAIVIPAGLTTFLTGLALISLRGGFSAVPRRIHVGMALTLSIFGVGAFLGRPALLRLGAAVKRGDLAAAEAAGQRFTLWVRCEDLLRLATLALMVLPI